MARRTDRLSAKRAIPVALAAAGLVFAMPGTGLAVGAPASTSIPSALGSLPFTPANVDPQLARKVAAIIGNDGLRFTPATRINRSPERTVTVAVRVDDATARAISVRRPIETAAAENGRERALEIAPTRYNLGLARGYQSFAQPQPTAATLPTGVRDLSMPDLSSYRPAETKSGKPSRFGSRLALDNETAAGRSPRTLESLGEQSVDLQGSYRVKGNLNVTAGVRLSQDRNRLNPLTDGIEDDQAVYVGTQLRF